MRLLAAALLLLFTSPLPAREPLQARVQAQLASASPGTRIGIVVVDADGRELVAVLPDQRFVPASNTKIFTTAAAYATLGSLDQPDAAGGTAVALDHGDVVLSGRGDARLSSAPDCLTNCLAQLADAVRASTRRVRDVIGDDSLFVDERWSPGMSWNNIPTRSGTGISALSLDDNEVVVTVAPAGAAGGSATIASSGYFTIDNRVSTVPAGQPSAVSFDRLPLERTVRISGTIAIGEPPRTLRLGIDDPAHHAAWRFAAMLRERGVRISGSVRARHRDPARASQPTSDLARLTAPPLAEDIRIINKLSHNLHAELLLRRLSRSDGGSIADGQKAVEAMMTSAGVPRWAYDFSDGSGMSSYNRVTPRATVALLRWIGRQPWGAAWRDSLPIGGVDGTLSRRFKGTLLEGKLFAKTGTLNQASALAGYLTTASGKELTFAVYAADMPGDASATATVDAALALIAAEN
jgi:D-alanyl-D-alanine carboxypeptidase/D-alanyl-D-alanine-endopeptidase (penicillin-binding protein 4)